MADMEQLEQLLPASLEGTDPELCIKLFKSTKKKNFNGLKRRINSSDQKWKNSFLERKGLEIVLDALSEAKETDEKLECISCINSILNSSSGMEYCMKNGEEFVTRYVEGRCSFFFFNWSLSVVAISWL